MSTVATGADDVATVVTVDIDDELEPLFVTLDVNVVTEGASVAFALVDTYSADVINDVASLVKSGVVNSSSVCPDVVSTDISKLVTAVLEDSVEI